MLASLGLPHMFRALPSSPTSAQPSFCSLRNPLFERQQTSMQISRTISSPRANQHTILEASLSLDLDTEHVLPHHPESLTSLPSVPLRLRNTFILVLALENWRKQQEILQVAFLRSVWSRQKLMHSVLGQPKGSQGCSSRGDAAKLLQGTVATLAVMQVVTSIDHTAYCRMDTPLAPQNPTQPAPTARV